MTDPTSDWFSDKEDPLRSMVSDPTLDWFPDAATRQPHWSDRVPQAVDMITSPISTGLQLGAGMAGWPVGAVAGIGSLLGEKLKGGSSADAVAAFGTAFEKNAMPVTELLSPKLPNEYAAPSMDIAGRGIEAGLHKVHQLGGIKKGLYPEQEADVFKGGLRRDMYTVGDKLVPIEKTHPAAAKIAEIFTELMAFKAGHVVGVKAKRALGKRVRGLEKILKKNPKDITIEEHKVVEEAINDIEFEADIPGGKETVYTPEFKSRNKGDTFRTQTPAEKVAMIEELRAWSESIKPKEKLVDTSGMSPAEVKLFEKLVVTEDLPKKVPGTGEPGGGPDLAPSRSPKEKLVDTSGMSTTEIRAFESMIVKEDLPVIGKPLKRSVGAASRKLKSEVKYDSSIEQGEGMDPWHSFTFQDGPAKNGSFTVTKKGRPTAKDIVEAGQKILETRKEKPKKLEVVEETQIDKYHRAHSVPAVRDAIEAGDVGTARAIYNQTRLVKSKAWGELIKNEIDSLEQGGKGYGANLEEARAEFKEAVQTEIDRPGAITNNDMYVIAGRLGDSRILEAIEIGDHGLRMERLKELAGIETRKEKPFVEKLNKGEIRTVVERTPDSIKGKKITREELKDVSPEEASQTIHDMLPEIKGFLQEGKGDGLQIKEKINEAIKGVPLEERVVYEAEKVMSAINAEMGKPKEVKKVEPSAQEIVDLRKALVNDELKNIAKEAKGYGVKVVASARIYSWRPENNNIDLFSIGAESAYGKRGKGQRELIIALDDVFRLAAEEGLAIQGPVINPEVGKFMGRFGAELRHPSSSGKAKTGGWFLPKEKVQAVIDSGGILKHDRMLKERAKVTPEAVAESVAEEYLRLNPPERLDLTPENYEKFEINREGLLNYKKKPTARDAIKSEKDMESFLEVDETKTQRQSKKKSKEKIEELGEEYADLYKEDHDLGDYGVGKMGKDLVDVFGRNDRGSFSGNKLSVKDIKKLHKVWRKAKDMGRELGEYLEAAFPKMSQEELQRIKDFINEHFEGSELFDISETGPVLRKGKTRLWKKNTAQERTIRHPDYQRAWYDNWKNMNPVKFLKSVGGHYGTTAGHFFDQVKWLAEEVYYPYRKAVKEIKIRKQNIRKQFLNPLKKMVGKKSRRKIRDHAIVQQMYERGPDGKILIKNGKRVFKEHAQEFMKENRIKAIPKLDANELHVYNELRRGFDILYEEINTMRANNGLTPFKKVPDYFTFMRMISAFERVGLKGEFMGKDPTFVLQEFARMKELPFQFRHARVKYRKYRIKNEPFDIFETYADLAYDHMGISPIVAKVKEITSSIKMPMQTLTKKGKIGKKRFNPLRRGDNINAAEYLTEWSHKISGVPMKYEAPPLVKKALNKINSNLGAAILGASARAVFIQPLALIGTTANIGLHYTLRGILDVPRPSKYREARLKSDVLHSRTPEASIADNLGQLGELKISEFLRIARNLSFKGLEVFDNLTAHATWNGAYRQAMDGRVPHNKGKMSIKEAARYADDVVIRTQGSALPGERAPIQYTSWGKTTTMFQTFVINNWNFLAYDALALHPNTKIKHALPKITRYVFAAMAANYLYEDIGGMKSPLGRPVKALLDGLDDNSTAVDIGIDVLGELVEPIPILGSARYGSHPFGPLVEKIGEIFTGGRYGMSPAKEIELLQSKGRFPDKSVQLGLEAAGVPGTGQAFKSYRAAKRGESPWGIIAGTYSKKRKKYSQK